MRTIQSTPKQDGYRMPGEFEPHSGCWMLWPERTDVWRSGAKPAQRAFSAVADAISQFEPVSVGASHSQYSNAVDMLPDHIRIVELSYDDAWMRDNGPIFVTNADGDVRGVDFEFNAWGGLKGGLYFPWDKDNQVARKVIEIERMARYKAPMVLEGGAITVDGQGTLLTTEQCLLNANRNPDMSRADIESCLQQYLGIEKVVWLGDGIWEDETDGHVDGLAFFARPGVVGLSWTDNPDNPSYDAIHDAYERLMTTTDALGRPFEVHKVPISGRFYVSAEMLSTIDSTPYSLERQGGYELDGDYANLYIANGGVVVPTYDLPGDAQALQIIQDIFPERKVVGVNSREIYMGGGMIHCITQEIPAGGRAP